MCWHHSVGSCLQVLEANEAVFVAVADTFASLTAAVLPAYCVRLRKVGKCKASRVAAASP